jgi:pimeloyl-ACP methyl ester carboxylesterase
VEQFTRTGLTFPVRDRGADDAPPVVLLHGFPQDAGAFDAVSTALVDAGRRTLVPTMRGYAATARPGGRSAYRTGELVDDLVALLDAAGLDRVHLVGHDWGGAVAWAAAARFPDRLSGLTVLSTPHPAALTASMLRSLQGLRSWYFAFFQLPWLPELVTGATAHGMLRRSGLPAADADRYAAALADPAARTAAINWYRGLPLSAQPAEQRITVPTTYVWGRRDPFLGRVAAERTAGFVTAPYRFVALDAGHWLPEREPAAVAAAVLDPIIEEDDRVAGR